MDSKNKAKELIQQRILKNRAIKSKQAKRKGPYGLVRDFIQTMEDVKARATTAFEFDTELQREAGLLLDRFKEIDPEVELELKWNRPDKAEKWEDLLIEGVMITWSPFWRRKHPLESDTKYIDMADLFMKGLLDD